jgi:hypothetical protein
LNSENELEALVANAEKEKEEGNVNEIFYDILKLYIILLY